MKTKKQTTILALFALLFCVIGKTSEAKDPVRQDKKPNVLFIAIDDLAGKAEHAEAEHRLKTALEAWRHETDDPALDPAFHDEVLEKVSARTRSKK